MLTQLLFPLVRYLDHLVQSAVGVVRLLAFSLEIGLECLISLFVVMSVGNLSYDDAAEKDREYGQQNYQDLCKCAQNKLLSLIGVFGVLAIRRTYNTPDNMMLVGLAFLNAAK